MKAKHSSFAPSLPAFDQPGGLSRSENQSEYCPSWLTTTLYLPASPSGSSLMAGYLRNSIVEPTCNSGVTIPEAAERVSFAEMRTPQLSGGTYHALAILFLA